MITITHLKECDANDPNIQQEVKDFYKQVNENFWPVKDNPFGILTNKDGEYQWYMFALRLENLTIYITDFGISDIKDATVGMTFNDKSRPRINISFNGVPKKDVVMRATDLFYWITDSRNDKDITLYL